MEAFFNFARARHAIYLRRQDGEQRPWTDDPILQRYRFTNVFRELDATSVWFAKHVRDPMRGSPDVLLATVLFRWFNRIVTGDAIFRQIADHRGRGRAQTAWEDYLQHGETDILRAAVMTHCGDGPYVTGAYIIKTPDGMRKLDGVLWCVEQFRTLQKVCRMRDTYAGVDYDVIAPQDGIASSMMRYNRSRSGGGVSLEQAWTWLRKFPYLGDFMAYEIVTDLRHTALLDRATDIYTWANPGPGAMRGLNRLHGRSLNYRQPKHVFVTEMRRLLQLASTEMAHVWPRNPSGLPVEMRDIEHTLCEFDKYERVRTGEGRPRGVYR